MYVTGSLFVAQYVGTAHLYPEERRSIYSYVLLKQMGAYVSVPVLWLESN
jgi:hypothetical protein